MSLRKTVFDTAATSFVSVARLLAQFLVIPFLARILSPADYGVVAMAMPFVLFAMMLADAGIAMSLVRTPVSERAVWSTCFWLSTGIGLVLTLVIMATAPLTAMAFGEPRLSPIVATLAIVVFAQALSAVPGALLQQQQKFKLIAIMEIVAMVCGIATALLVAMKGGGAWALVAQQLMFYAVRVTLTFFYSSFRPVALFDLKNVREHLIFGRDMLGINIARFASRSLDNLIIGGVLTTAAVGVYSMAYQFASIPLMLVTGPLQFVMYAKLVRVKDDVDAIRRMFLLLSRSLAIVIFPAMGMVAVAHEPIFNLLLSEKWAQSGRIFIYITPGCALQSITMLGSTILLALGRTDIRLRLILEFGGLWVVSLFVSSHFGLEWVAIVYSCVAIGYSPRSLSVVLPLIGCRVSAFWKTIMIPAAATLACLLAYCAAQQVWSMGEWQQLALAIALGAVALAIGAAAQWRTLAKEADVFRLAA